ncbi:MAG: hypothetical protein ACK4VO_05585 [Pseudobdellovibrio sp.]
MKLFLSTLALAFSINAQTNELNNVVLLDGSVARCQSVDDVGSRAYRLSAVRLDGNTVELNLKSFVCQQTSSGFELFLVNLCQSERYNRRNSVLENLYSQPVLQVTNNEGTRELARLDLNPNADTQTVLLNLEQLKSKSKNGSVDLTLQMIQTINVNGKFLDQRIISGGHYRLSF